MNLDITFPVPVVAGCSGVGKNTVLDIVLAATGRTLCQSLTTRKPRDGDRPGKYRYVSYPVFLARKPQLLECAPYGGHWYGSLIPSPNSIMEIEIRGAGQVLQLLPTARLIFLVPRATPSKNRFRLFAGG